jgi:hypothetical protein
MGIERSFGATGDDDGADVVRQASAVAALHVIGLVACVACPGNAAVRRDQIEGACRRSGQIQEYLRNLAPSRPATAGCRSVQARLPTSPVVIDRTNWNG